MDGHRNLSVKLNYVHVEGNLPPLPGNRCLEVVDDCGMRTSACFVGKVIGFMYEKPFCFLV